LEASPFLPGENGKSLTLLMTIGFSLRHLEDQSWLDRAHDGSARAAEFSDDRYYGNEYPIAVYPLEMKKGTACRALRFSPMNEKIILSARLRLPG
jgi:hypothetical protein